MVGYFGLLDAVGGGDADGDDVVVADDEVVVADQYDANAEVVSAI